MKSYSIKTKKYNDELLDITGFLDTISEEHRLKILYFLKGQEKCVCEIWKYLDIPQNLTSHHLKILKSFGLISSRKEGLKIFYSINKKSVQSYLARLNKLLN